MSKSKDDVIHDIYYDKAGFNSVLQTYKEAKQKDKTITLENVKDWFKKNVEQKQQVKGYNTYIVPYANYEYQMDLFFITDLPNQRFNVGVIMIDTFSKYMVIVPIKSKSEGDVAAGLLESLQKMGATPKMIYSDDEGSLSTPDMKRYFEEHNIKHVISRGHAPVAERAIRTFKSMLYKRVEHAKNDNAQWTDFIYEITLTYNNKLVHSITEFTPAKARLKENQRDVWLNTFIKSNHTRTYSGLEEGDKVRIFRKRKKGEKERVSVWSDKIYEVERIVESLGIKFYRVNGMDKEYSRNELLKVS